MSSPAPQFESIKFSVLRLFSDPTLMWLWLISLSALTGELLQKVIAQGMSSVWISHLAAFDNNSILLFEIFFFLGF